MTSNSIPSGEDFRLSRLGVEVKVRTLLDGVYSVRKYEAVRQRHRIARKELEKAHPTYAAADCNRVAIYICAQFALVFAYVLDLILVGVVAEYFAQQLFPNVKWL